MANSEEVISRLSLELENAQTENIQAAEYGLQVLEENQQLQFANNELQSQLESLQRELDNARHEFDLSTKALHKTKDKTKKAFCEGELREDDLEKQRKDAVEKLALVEKEKENEVGYLQNVLRNSVSEVDRLMSVNAEITTLTQVLEHQKKTLNREVKNLKSREAQLMTDYSELEEENCLLQKQISLLKQTQAEYEGFKHDVRRLEEETEFLNSQLDETLKLKDLLERQLDDAHETIQKERELRLSLKKELSTHVNKYDVMNDSFYNESNYKSSKNKEADDDEDVDLDHPLIRHITSDLLIHSTASTPRRSNADPGNDLFSELNLSEANSTVTKLKQQLNMLEDEKKSLQATVREQKQLLDGNEEEAAESNVNLSLEITQLKEEISKLKDDQEKSKKNSSKKLEQAVQESKSKQNLISEQNKNLEMEIESVRSMLSRKDEELNKTSEKLTNVSDVLSQLYHHVCLTNGDEPELVHLKSIKNNTKLPDDEENKENIDAERPKENAAFEPDTAVTVLSAMSNQIAYLRTAIDKLSTNVKDEIEELPQAQPSQQESAEKMRGLECEVLRLRSLLSSKREQIATLRTVLKANKHTAEVAITNLKEKYQTEKLFVSETLLKLRAELKSLKEDAVTFAQLRMMFAARCDEYVAQLDAMQRHLASAEDEKRTLNTLLRKTITQKLALTQKLEDLQFEIEMNNRQGGNPSYASVTKTSRQKTSKMSPVNKLFRS